MRYVMGKIAQGLEWIGERLDDIDSREGSPINTFSFFLFNRLELPIRQRWQVWR